MSSGSTTVVLLSGGVVGEAEGRAGADQQRLRRVQRPIEQCGDLGHRQIVEVTQRQSGAMVRTEPVEHPIVWPPCPTVGRLALRWCPFCLRRRSMP